MSILCYHSIHPTWQSPLAVPPPQFRAQATWLSRHRTVVPVTTAIAAMSRTGKLPSGMSALTFDDGFADNLDYALPVLSDLGLPWTIFLVAETLTPKGRVVDWVDSAPPWPLQTLSLDQVRCLADAGVTIASHSWAHHDLTTLSHGDCIRDLRESRELLQDLVGARVDLLAYPRGLHNPGVRRAASKAGYAYALALPQSREVAGRYAVPRVGVFPGNTTTTLRVKSARHYLGLRTHPVFPAARRALRPLLQRLGAGVHSRR